jgi:hypothetical protein
VEPIRLTDQSAISLPEGGLRVQLSVDLSRVDATMLQALPRTFEVERKVGHPREYCLKCEPEGYSVVATRSGRRKLRRRVPLVKMSDLYPWGA